jgi:nondiscriminating aspartyl-tRNA synthetase
MSTIERVRSGELSAHVGERAWVMGWLHSRRALGGLTFLVVRDGWGLVQVVAEGAAAVEPLGEAEAGLESVIAVEGEVAAAAQAPGGCELRDPHIEVITPVEAPPPVALNRRQLNASLATLLDTAVVTNRHPARRATLRLASGIMRGFRAALGERHFTEIQTPKIVASATESGANVFRLDYFGGPAFLAQSPQFYKQVMVGVYERVFEVGPVFRAEPHDTTRHINEYVSLDAEMGFIESHFTVMMLLREVIAEMMATLAEYYASDLRTTGATLPEVPRDIPHLHFADAQDVILRRHGVDVRGEPDLSPQDERWLGEWARAEHGSDWLFVTGYPMRKRPFYTHPDPERPDSSNSFDLLFRGMELVTGGQRRHRYADYVDALQAAGLPLESFAEYLDAFRYGMPPHGGFAIGLERFVAQLTGLPSVKLATTFPRDLHRLAP